MDIYLLEKELESKIAYSADDAIKYALLETCPPISDYFRAIEVLWEQYPKYKDHRMAIIGAFLCSTWRNFEANRFIEILNGSMQGMSNQDKSIVYYLNAYDVFMRQDDLSQNDAYKELLENSIQHADRFVYNYYRLAKVSRKSEASRLMERCVKNVERVIQPDNTDNDYQQFTSYTDFVDEHILGTALSKPNYEDIMAFHAACHRDGEA